MLFTPVHIKGACYVDKCEISLVVVAGVNVLRAIGSRDIRWQLWDLIASLLSSKSAQLIVA